MQEIPEGVQVFFSHGRKVDGQYGTWYRTTGKRGDLKSWVDAGLQPASRGGTTTAFLALPNGTEVIGWAECSVKDNYNKKIGRDIALGRALKAAKFKYPELFDTRPLKAVT